ncbi:MAG: ribose-phosphate pyrophosphokinase [Anaerolineae bacterium]|nr:ribose-phosphate pyrophosphokinase [Anaerolineae bacterium]
MDGKRMYGELAIFSGSGNPELAREICDYLGTPLRGVDLIEFPNENIFVKLHQSVRSQDVFVVQSLSSPVNRNIMELLIMLDTLKRASAGRITAVMPYFAYGRSDKKDQPRVPITARLLADMIAIAGADRFLTLDLHAGQIQGFFSIPGDDLSAFNLLSDYFLHKQIPNAVVVSADLGFAKKGRNFAEKLHLPMAFVEKRRTGPQSQALTVIGDVRGRNAIVVDDEVDTAGSVTETAHILRENGVCDLYASFTHAVFSPPAVERLRAAGFREVVTTNTIPIPAHRRFEGLTVLSVAPFLGEVIHRVHNGESVGAFLGD